MRHPTAQIPLINDEELRKHVSRLLMVKPLARHPEPAEEASRHAPRHTMRYQAVSLLLQGEERALFDALPNPVLVIGREGLLSNKAFQLAMQTEQRESSRNHGHKRRALAPIDETAFVTLIQKCAVFEARNLFFPLGNKIYTIQTDPHDDATIVHCLPRFELPPTFKFLTFSVRLVLCLRLSGFALKQAAEVAGCSIRSAQHVSRYYKTEMQTLRQHLPRIAPSNSCP